MAGRLKVAAFAAAALAFGGVSFGGVVTENFSTNTDGYWEHLNNTTAPQNYAWSNTDNTGTSGGGSGAGELGGTITRDASPANFYAFNVGSLDPDTEAFSASGKM